MNELANRFQSVVLFTFHENEKLCETFVEALEGYFGSDNLRKLDQSTYGITNAVVDIDCLNEILKVAEKTTEKHKEGDEISVLFAEDSLVVKTLLFNDAFTAVNKDKKIKI